MNLDTSQQSAIEHSTSNKLTAITGAAGHGKTTILKQIAESLEEQGEDIELCSFTGRAAARISEATGFPATTIHRMLDFRGIGFMRHSLEGVSILCDEASMLSSDLLAEILKRNPKRIILAGDASQLLPIEEGQPFLDIMNLYPENKVELTKAYRNKEAIYQAATAIRKGEMPQSLRSEGELFSIQNIGDAYRTHCYLLGMVKNKYLDLDKTQILVPRNGEMNADKVYPPSTINRLNIDIKNIVNPSETRLSEGDKVMCIKNDAELGIYNGTLGTVKEIDCSKTLHFETDDQVVEIPNSKVKHIKLAYAISVHKYQGSQAENIVFIALWRDSHSLLNRNMVYTAVTRAQKKCLIIGEHGAVKRALEIVPVKKTVLQELNKK